MRSAWNVGDWGEACGPKPGGGSAPAGTATIRQAGGELSISGAGRSYSTAECWEQMPGLTRASHSGGQRGWRTVCRSAPGDPRQATVVTTVSASDTYITFDETGQYQFVIQGSNCTASVRRSRSFRLIQREGEAPEATAAASAPPAAASAAPAPSAKPAVVDRCEKPGPAARLEVRPSRKLMRPGEEFGFRALISDAAGCVLTTAPAWRIVKNESLGQLIAPGKIRVADDAPESEIALTASVADRSVEVVVEVASKERYEALLKSGGFTQAGESTEAAATAIASGTVGTRSTVAKEGVSMRRVTFVAVLGGAALVLGLLGVVLALRSRRRQKEQPPQFVLPPAPPPAPEVMTAVVRQPVNPPNMICPTCREEYPPHASFCEQDGNRLIPAQQGGEARGPTGGVCPICGQGFDPGVSICPRHGEELVPAAAWAAREDALPTFKICPVCGTQYPGDGRFCGSDGAALVPVN